MILSFQNVLQSSSFPPTQARDSMSISDFQRSINEQKKNHPANSPIFMQTEQQRDHRLRAQQGDLQNKLNISKPEVPEFEG